MLDPKWKWLESTRTLQEEVYDYDFQWMRDHEIALTQYIQWNIFAAYQELAETAVEFSWKPWATDRPFVNRNRVRDELIDAMHFIGNILVGIGVTDSELEDHYQVKQERNRRRAASGNYSAKKGLLGEGSDDE
jgi:dimeric dUTPase (all-alpha-NTP-PPase superfamily)